MSVLIIPNKTYRAPYSNSKIDNENDSNIGTMVGLTSLGFKDSDLDLDSDSGTDSDSDSDTDTDTDSDSDSGTDSDSDSDSD